MGGASEDELKLSRFYSQKTLQGSRPSITQYGTDVPKSKQNRNCFLDVNFFFTDEPGAQFQIVLGGGRLPPRPGTQSSKHI